MEENKNISCIIKQSLPRISGFRKYNIINPFSAKKSLQSSK